MALVYEIKFVGGLPQYLPIYVGVTCRSLKARMAQHRIQLARGCEWRLYRSWRQAEAVQVHVLFQGDLKFCLGRERQIIGANQAEAERCGLAGALNVNLGGEHPFSKPGRKQPTFSKQAQQAKAMRKFRGVLDSLGRYVRNVPRR